MRNTRNVVAAGLFFCGLLFVQPANADDNKWQGCLVGTEDNYVLRTADGELFRLHSDGDIDEHVGNTVEVSGKIEQNERDQQAQTQAQAAKNAGVAIPKLGINVEDLKTISKGCDNANRQ
ncbi:MAG: DUF5818 domain-containing protein [Candidatus Korobacteraceae bacterium]